MRCHNGGASFILCLPMRCGARMLALFDLDNTLIAGDSDHAWGEFLCTHGLVDAAEYRARNEQFYRDYQAGTLDMQEFLAFALKPLRDHPPERLHQWRENFLRECIEPLLLPAAHQLLAEHRRAGDRLLIITATNRFITEPIAALLGVTELLATDPEMADGRYTGRVAGTPCYREGKVERLADWAALQGLDPFDAVFYSDSANDLPLLEKVRLPRAVDPDPALRKTALERGWPVLSLRGA